MDTIYKEEILEHYNNPQNFGSLENFDTSSKQTNPLCGDEIEIFILFKKKEKSVGGVASPHVASPHRRWTIGIIKDVSFTGVGCAISIAGASILTEFVKGKTKKELTKFSEKDMLTLLGIEVSETRKKCALLALAVLKDCLG